MPYTNTWEEHGLYRKFTENISGDEILESNFELHAHPEFQKIKYIINDFTEVTGHSIQGSHTKAYASSDGIISNSKGPLKIAIIVTKDPLIALANAYREQIKGDLLKCEIYSTLEDARNWLD